MPTSYKNRPKSRCKSHLSHAPLGAHIPGLILYLPSPVGAYVPIELLRGPG